MRSAQPVTLRGPDGAGWIITRTWLARPDRAREELEVDPFDGVTLGPDPDIGEAGPERWLTSVVLNVLVGLVVALLVVLLLPPILALLGLVVVLGLLGWRVLWIATWQISARRGPRELRWHVRGLWRSRRAVDAVAQAIASGTEPVVDGRRGYLVEPGDEP